MYESEFWVYLDNSLALQIFLEIHLTLTYPFVFTSSQLITFLFFSRVMYFYWFRIGIRTYTDFDLVYESIRTWLAHFLCILSGNLHTDQTATLLCPSTWITSRLKKYYIYSCFIHVWGCPSVIPRIVNKAKPFSIKSVVCKIKNKNSKNIIRHYWSHLSCSSYFISQNIYWPTWTLRFQYSAWKTHTGCWLGEYGNDSLAPRKI